jgi:hypothetical protein
MLILPAETQAFFFIPPLHSPPPTSHSKNVAAHGTALMHLINLPTATTTRCSLRSFADQLESHIQDLEAVKASTC